MGVGSGVLLSESADAQIAEDPQRHWTEDLQGGRTALALVTDLLLQPLAMELDKVLTSQDHSITKVTNSAAQPFLGREFALFLVNDRLGFGLVKRRRVALATSRAAQI